MDDEDAVHCVIWLGCTSKCCASSATVFWPLIAANATFALNAGVWFRRARLLIVSPDSSGTACPLSGRNSTYPLVQISGAGSMRAGLMNLYAVCAAKHDMEPANCLDLPC